MLEIIAQGKRNDDRWRHSLPVGIPLDLGRTEGDLHVAWDDQISRRHAQLQVVNNRLHVMRLSTARNPVFFRGQAVDDVWLDPGDHFVIGQTSFSILGQHARATLDVPQPEWEEFFPQHTLRQVRYPDAEKRIAVLGQLPDLISSARSDFDLFSLLTRVLLAGIDSAQGVALVKCDPQNPADPVEILHWDRRTHLSGNFEPSERLIRAAIEKDQSILHVWGPRVSDSTYTVDPNHNWAFAVPVASRATPGWALYVAGTAPMNSAGTHREPMDPRGDVKFAELVGSTLANIRQIQQFERNEASLRSFFSPIVMQTISARDPAEVLAPRECQISVIFCDLRGFSKASEELAGSLFDLLTRVSSALGITTRAIHSSGGVIGDFHGDAAMGFWGWPIDQADTAARACRAALEIQREIEKTAHSNQSIRDFTMGIGIASGPAVAGRIGTDDQVKVTAFGPVVNLAARLESMTRIVQVPILIDGATATFLRNDSAWDAPIRAIASIRPFGLSTATEVFQLWTAPRDSTSDVRGEYERARALFHSSRWREAAERLEAIGDDAAAAFLLQQIQRFDYQPPTHWDGVIHLDKK